jgi:hypothetical protein
MPYSTLTGKKLGQRAQRNINLWGNDDARVSELKRRNISTQLLAVLQQLALLISAKQPKKE